MSWALGPWRAARDVREELYNTGSCRGSELQTCTKVSKSLIKSHMLGRDPGVLAWKAAAGSLNNDVEISAAATAEDTVWNLCQVDFVLEQTSSK